VELLLADPLMPANPPVPEPGTILDSPVAVVPS
jgi:hypothetical protein